MSLRDLVAGSDMCTPSDGAGPSNAVGTLVNNLLGGASKTQEQLRELPTVQPGFHGPLPGLLTPESAAAAAASGSGVQIPGVGPSSMNNAAAHAFLHNLGQPAPHPEEWDQIFQGPRQPPFQHAPPPPALLPPGLHAPGAAPPAALAPHFQAFLQTARNGSHFAAGPLPPQLAASLSVADKCRIRDRSTILARHVFSDQGAGFADQQVNNLLASLHIDPAELPSELPHVHSKEWHDVWKAAGGQRPARGLPMVSEDVAAGAHAQWDALWGQAQQGYAPPRPLSTGWAAEFEQIHGPPPQAAWAEEFAQERPAEAWANEFASTSATESGQRLRSGDPASAMQSTRAMVDLLSKDDNPKMQNSKFLQFVSKMSKGELIFEDNKVVERPAQGTSWADEFQQSNGATTTGWVSDFEQQQQQQQQQQAGHASTSAGFKGDWADEFARGVANLNLGEDLELEGAWSQVNNWVDEFQQGDEDTFREWERLYGHGLYDTSYNGKGEYVFAKDNPFIGDPEAFQKGRDLFRRGVLSEAALALEAEVQAHSDNAEAWRLLGTVHAENDDDQQAIAAMTKALGADPNSSEVLLALGVSHTNELDRAEALTYLSRWLAAQPQYAHIAEAAGHPPDSSQQLSHVVRMFSEAARVRPEDAELHMALGVLHHLSRQFSEAVSAFEMALRLRPQDYGLWNKLGATLANHSRSSEAIGAYQKALDLKPNYMRAWTNMGISFANVGDYDKSARFYVRALNLNPNASHVWGYLRTSLACAGKLNLMAAVDNQDLATLLKELPL